VQQGATLSLDCYAAAITSARLIGDGANFWISYTPAQSTQNLAMITTAAALTVWTIAFTAGTNRTTKSTYEMFYERGRIVIFMVDPPDSGNTVTMTVFNTVTFVQESYNYGTLSAVSAGQYTRMIPGGDFTAIILGQGGTSTVFTVLKYTNASVIGVTVGAAAKGGMVSIAALAGAYGINSLKGTPAKTFDHTTATIPGNKGTVLNYGAVLKGF
jgi:hypothetical protein